MSIQKLSTELARTRTNLDTANQEITFLTHINDELQTKLNSVENQLVVMKDRVEAIIKKLEAHRATSND